MIQDYLFSTSIPIDSLFVKIGLFGSLGLLIVSIAASLMLLLPRFRHVNQAFISPILHAIQITSFILTVLFFLRFQAIPPFRMRIWIWPVAIIFLGWVGWLGFRYKKRKPLVKQANEFHEHYEKYLPKPKTRQ